MAWALVSRACTGAKYPALREGYAFCWWLLVPLGGIWDVANKVRRAGYAMLCYAMPSQQAGKDCDGVQPLSLMAGAGAIVIIILSSRRAIEQRTSSCVPYGLASQADHRYTGSRYITTYTHQSIHPSSPTRSPSVPIALSISKKKSDTVAPNPETNSLLINRPPPSTPIKPSSSQALRGNSLLSLLLLLAAIPYHASHPPAITNPPLLRHVSIAPPTPLPHETAGPSIPAAQRRAAYHK